MVLQYGKVFMHHGFPVVAHQFPLKVAKIKTCHGPVYLHPRYALAAEDEVRKLRAHQRGRSLEILLKSPVENADQQRWLLSVKGVGAYGDKEMQIHPTDWWNEFPDHCDSRWEPRDTSNRRHWGAVLQDWAVDEVNNAKRFSFIPFVDYFSPVSIPRLVCKKIFECAGQRYSGVRYGQVSRALCTNIRSTDEFVDDDALIVQMYEHSLRSKLFFRSPEELLAIDLTMLQQIANEVWHKRKSVKYNGWIAENRLMDGSFIDAENVSVVSHNGDCDARFLRGLARSSGLLLLKHDREIYADKAHRLIYKTIDKPFADCWLAQISIDSYLSDEELRTNTKLNHLH